MEGIRPGLLHIHITRHQLVRASLVVTMETGALPECFQDSWPAIQRIMADNSNPNFLFFEDQTKPIRAETTKTKQKNQTKKPKKNKLKIIRWNSAPVCQLPGAGRVNGVAIYRRRCQIQPKPMDALKTINPLFHFIISFHYFISFHDSFSKQKKRKRITNHQFIKSKIYQSSNN